MKDEVKTDKGYQGNARIKDLFQPVVATFTQDDTVEDAIEKIRSIPKNVVFTYGYIVDDSHKLIGVLVLRDLLTSEQQAKLVDIMLKGSLITLHPDLSLMDAMKKVASMQIPEYPVCDDDGKLMGIVRGQELFKDQAIEISAQAGKMVGVTKEEQANTPFSRSLKLRHPWLQVNLVTAFVAGAVVGVFQEIIDQIVLLAVFLPVLAGQAGNTGAQSMAITIRALSLSQLEAGKYLPLFRKEFLLGIVNGAVIGVITAIVMYVMADMQGNPNAVNLSFVIFVAMTLSCVVSGLGGAVLPVVLDRLKMDPAASTSIFLTTATDVVSMGSMLGLASLLIL